MSAGFGTIAPFRTNYGAATATSPGILTTSAQSKLGPMTWITAHQDSTAEALLALWRLDQDTGSDLRVFNQTATDAAFSPGLKGTQSGTEIGLSLYAVITTDSGTNPAMVLGAYKANNTKVTTRSLCKWLNYDTYVLDLIPLNAGANAALSWGTQVAAAPAFTTRSSGTRTVLFGAINASTMDYAIGVEASGPWISCPQANSTYAVNLYAGITKIVTFRGDGQRTYTGGAVRKSRIALTTPVTIAVTDDIVFVKLTTPGAVAVSWPASPVAGQEYCVVDATGDANTNNITHTPAAGNFNGAGTKVQNVAYSRLTGAYTGAEWIGS